MLPYVGSQFDIYPRGDPLNGLAPHIVGCTVGALLAPFAYRGMVLYTSQIETCRTMTRPEQVKSSSFVYKGSLHAIWKQIQQFRGQSHTTLFRGGLTLVAMVPVSSLGAWSMFYHFMQATTVEDPSEFRNNVLYGFASVLATEYLNAPLRALYLRQAASSPASPRPDLNLRSLKSWLPLHHWKHGAHAFALSGTLFSATFLTGVMLIASTFSTTEAWRKEVLREPVLPIIDNKPAIDNQLAIDDKKPIGVPQTYLNTSKKVLLGLSGPVMTLGTSFTFLVGLRQLLNYHMSRTNPDFLYTRWWHAWSYQLQAGRRAIFLGVLSSAMLWSSTPNKLFVTAFSYAIVGGSDNWRAQQLKYHEDSKKD